MPGDLFAKKPFPCPMPWFPPLSCGSLLPKAPWFNGMVPFFTSCYLGWGIHTLNLAWTLHHIRGKEGEPFGMDHALPCSLEG